MAALGYDATNIVIAALKSAGKPADGDYTSDGYRARLRNAIAATKSFQGVTGVITIGPDRNAIKPAVVLAIHNQSTSLAATIQPSDVPL
jgi:branched-chain amino acid transport system substrate-binding protein